MAKILKSSRIVPDPLPRIESIDQCDEAMLRIGRVGREIARLEAAQNDEIAVVRKKHAAPLAALAAERDELDRNIIAFETYHRETLFAGEQKSRVLTYGTLNLRRIPPFVELVRSKIDRIAEIKERFVKSIREKLIRVKEEVSKEGILDHARALEGKRLKEFEDQLALCSLRIVRDDETFGYNLHEDEIAKHLAARPTVITVAKGAK
jgi:phage host-nuclease inhibitor protein Gam